MNFLFAAENSTSYPSGKGVEDSLAEVPAGSKAKVIGFSADFPPDRRSYLQAYGLVPNYWVQVLGHSPVTIVRLDNIELALENELARGIKVQWGSESGEE
jgi:Fe2+ transport system protein FeoA